MIFPDLSVLLVLVLGLRHLLHLDLQFFRSEQLSPRQDLLNFLFVDSCHCSLQAALLNCLFLFFKPDTLSAACTGCFMIIHEVFDAVPVSAFSL